MSTNRGKGSVGVGETGKKVKTTPDAGGKSVSEKSQVTRTSTVNPFEKSSSQHTEYFVGELRSNTQSITQPKLQLYLFIMNR